MNLCGAIVLAGGASSRMGQSKPWLPFGPELMLARVVRLLSEVAAPIVVVAREGQTLPPLPPSILGACDRQAERGPLEGLRAGLAALPAGVDLAYVTACDTPLLVPAFIGRLVELLGPHDAAVPRTPDGCHPLSAVYRRGVLSQIEQLLAADVLRTMTLLDRVATRFVEPAELTDIDPQLATLANVNGPSEYLTALALAGFAPPADARQRFDES